MVNPYGVPEISVQEVASRREDLLLLDVREQMELYLANLGEDVAWAPLSDLATRRVAALPPEVTADKEQLIVVFCHTGVRSAQVTAWLRSEGWSNVSSMAGGIEAYALQVDPAVGRY
jgi:rhodanese-related sulfurtransferase